MRRKNVSVSIPILLGITLLAGCIGPVAPPTAPPPVTEPTDYSLVGTANYVPSQLQSDPYPLFVGARWIYHNAASYWNPQIASSGLLESEVVAEVQGPGARCYVLHTRYSNGPDEYLFVHRTENAVRLLGSRLGAAAGAQTRYALGPGLAFLSLPLERGKTWSLTFREGSVDARVLHREVVAIEAGQVSTLLGAYPAILVGAWRVHYDLFGMAPRLFGGPNQFLWFADGVGVVKHVLNSVNYELTEFRLRNEVTCLDERDASARIQNGGLLIVQLRGASPDLGSGGGWRLEAAGSPPVIEWIDTAFYGDLEPQEPGAGTYAYQFRGVATGETTLRFARFNQETGAAEGEIEYSVRVQ